MNDTQNLIKFGEDQYIHECVIKHLCSLFPEEIQSKFWGKLVNDCTDEEYNRGLKLYVNSMNLQ